MGEKRSVLIAGASSDIGLSLLKRMISRGWRVGAHCFKGCSRLASLRSIEGANEDSLIILKSPLGDHASAERLVGRFAEWAGNVDALVHLTGNVSQPCHWENLKEDTWQEDLSTNLTGPFFLAQSAYKRMKMGRGGRIVFTSTASASHGGGPMTLAYGVAKAGLECLTKALAKSGAPHGILVNAIAPGLIRTRFHGERLRRDEKDLEARLRLVPLGRAGTPEEVAALIEFLLGEGAGFMTGEVITMSGGDQL